MSGQPYSRKGATVFQSDGFMKRCFQAGFVEFEKLALGDFSNCRGFAYAVSLGFCLFDLSKHR